MNKRVRQVRMTLNLKQADFGTQLGVTSATISRIESGERALTEQMLLAISREFGVNATWLRTGAGEMFDSTNSLATEQFYAKNGLDALDRQILEAYIALPEAKRRVFKEFVSKIALLTPEVSAKHSPPKKAENQPKQELVML